MAKQPRKPSLQSGRAFVDLRPGEEYVVRLRNTSPHEAAVTLTIDGLSMFAFSEEGNFGSQVLIPAGRFVEIPGWYVTNEKTDLFEIGSYGESAAAAKLLPSTSVGVITATFHEAVAGSDKDPKATKIGEQIGLAYEEVKRVVKPALATGSWKTVLVHGLLFGLVAYATYDLTNLATLKGFPANVVLPDLAWGMFVTTAAGFAGWAAGRRFN